MTSYWNDLRATGAMTIPNCKLECLRFFLHLLDDKFTANWWKYEDFKRLKVILYFFILH